jgi:DMSO/TMAO reductase YedYZ molybdopterin-dependent catalytic subunit
MKQIILFPFGILILFVLVLSLRSQEITEYKGLKLTPLSQQRTTHVEQVPEISPASYRLKIVGEVKQPLELKYEEVLALPQESKVITMNCVEGWSYTALWTGVRISDLLEKAQVVPEAKAVIFHAVGGTYSSALPPEFIKDKKILLAFKINNIILPPERGFPFMVAAEGKFGYKWVQWVEKIEVSDKDYKGFWETRGYSNKADIKK